MNFEQSEALYEEAKTLMPGGVNSPVRAFSSVGRDPVYIATSKGDRIVDVDGNSYIDYVNSWGPNILGAANEEVVALVKAACDHGLTYGACHAGEIALAKKIVAHVPSVEKVRLVNSGTEAVMSAVRVARGYTNREKIIKFSGCYHGHADMLLVQAGSGLLTQGIASSAGVPGAVASDTLVATYNDLDSVKELFVAYPEEIACVIVEPCAANMGVVLPEEGFLSGLRELTEAYGALLIFDEVITGFRLGIGGAGAYYGVKADLTTLGKIVGGGMPLAAFGGRSDIMDCVAPLGAVYQAGTLSGNPVATAAGCKTIEILERDDAIYERLEKKAQRLADALRATGAQVNQEGSLLTAFFTKRKVRTYADAVSSDTAAYATFFHYLLEHGIYTAPSQFEAMFVSDALTEEDLAYTIETIRSYSL